MSSLTIITAILALIAGIGIFLIACQMMSNNLESASGDRLKKLFANTGRSRLVGVGIGALGTAAIQSSGATTVMVIGFVNVGIMSLTQAATIIYGANIGTTITAQIVALGLSSGAGLSTTAIFAAFAGIGAFFSVFSKRDSGKTLGGIIAGFGMLFVGLSMMSDSMENFAQLDSVRYFIARISNPVLLVLIGAVFTAIIQSSSVMTSVAITMAVTGLISLNQGIYITLGSNIGSCVVAIIAGMTSGLNAKRTALIHLFFNCFGVLVFLLAAGVMFLVTEGAVNFGTIFEHLFPNAPQLQMAMFHTIFNVATVLIILPMTDTLVRLVCRLIPEPLVNESEQITPHFYFVDEKMLRTPIIAVRQVKLEIEHMAQMAMQNYDRSLKMVSSLDFSEKDDFTQTEATLDFLNHELVQYIVRLNALQIPQTDHQFLTNAIRSVSDLERIGDYAENITEYADILRDANERFSDEAISEIEQMRELVFNVYQFTMKAYMNTDREAYWQAHDYEDQVDDLNDLMEQRHIERLAIGKCSALVGAQYIELASNSERISDHLINVGKTIGGLYPRYPSSNNSKL
ncbi:MAG: Na/Pi cotransporter family protein [Bacteroidales bacterium]|nr:Na/Pi cotransporter family protein [Candidatus Colicola coprequi]